jgi:type II secretory pathway pseudopilin PulG
MLSLSKHELALRQAQGDESVCHAGRGPAGERGFTLLETMIMTAIVGFTLLAFAAFSGFGPPRRRVAALALQGALAETRALAEANADATSSTPTGATLTVDPLPDGHGSKLTIYVSRPIPGAPALTTDPGMPPERVPVRFNVAGLTAIGEPFTILVSSSGYASIAPNYAYDPAHPVALASDPGCDEAHGVLIAVSDDVASDAHPFDCREARYEADVRPTSAPSGVPGGPGPAGPPPPERGP